jgi:hypothetical protein
MSPLHRNSNPEPALDPFEGEGQTISSTSVETVTVGEVLAATPALIRAKADFRELYTELPWIDSGETAALLAIQIATGDPADAGKDIESQSVRNLKLVNKVHTIVDIALADSSMGENAGPDFYARVSAVDADGSPFSYSIGGWIPLGQLRAKYGTFPWRCQITAQPSKQGNPAYRYTDV